MVVTFRNASICVPFLLALIPLAVCGQGSALLPVAVTTSVGPWRLDPPTREYLPTNTVVATAKVTLRARSHVAFGAHIASGPADAWGSEPGLALLGVHVAFRPFLSNAHLVPMPYFGLSFAALNVDTRISKFLSLQCDLAGRCPRPFSLYQAGWLPLAGGELGVTSRVVGPFHVVGAFTLHVPMEMVASRVGARLIPGGLIGLRIGG